MKPGAVQGPDVGSSLEHGPVGPFGLPVGLGAAGPDPHVLHAQAGEGVAKDDGTGVGERVIAHHRLDVDAVVGEERVRTRVDASARVARLVGRDFRVHETGVIIDHGVDGVVAAATPVRPPVRTPLVAKGPLAAALGDASELLHVHAQELARNGPFVAGKVPAGGAVHPREPVHPMAHEDPVHGRHWQPHVRRDTRWTPLVRLRCRTTRRSSRSAVRCGRRRATDGRSCRPASPSA